MAVSLELIEKLRERAEVSYEEAKAALEKCDGDIVEALIYLEQQNKIKKPPQDSACAGFTAKAKKLLKTCNQTRLVISKQEEKLINLSLTIVILVTIFIPPLTIIGLLAALLTNHKIRIEKPGCDEIKINKTLEDISSAVSNMGNQVAEAIKKE
ncbi:MAG: DUF4342 domain-containing protein [Syntrophomonadaceae bacterium]|nr:DUF4342 domain-containing protein [Syntrophomonadaceae bacterium]MDD3024514.1 DUF4342 domain-containing protein [Syntrophomonadaceae bacterium]